MAQKEHSFKLYLSSATKAQTFAQAISTELKAGDTLLLDGPVGVGKSHLSRAIIRTLAPHEIDIPSPTFTLVQAYDTSLGELWHADLYRLSCSDEVLELGLLDAFKTAICLIEWPGKLESYSPANPINITLSYLDDTSFQPKVYDEAPRLAVISFKNRKNLAKAIKSFMDKEHGP